MSTITLRGYFNSYEEQYNRIKILMVEDKFTENYIENSSKTNGHSPTFAGGFYIKYNNKSKFYTNTQETTIYFLKDNPVICEVQKKTYNHPDRSGWYLILKKMSLLNSG